jgi:hypothetical protein
MPTLAIKRQLGDEIWSNYFKFCVIRNPFDKAVSAYYFFKDCEGNRSRIKDRQPLFRRIQSKFISSSKRDSPQYLFEDWILDGGMFRDRDNYVIDDRICVDAFIRFENLQEDIEKICTKLGLGFDPGRIPHHKKYSGDKRPGPAEIFTRKSIEAISKMYRFEIEQFGYQPPVV